MKTIVEMMSLYFTVIHRKFRDESNFYDEDFETISTLTRGWAQMKNNRRNDVALFYDDHRKFQVGTQVPISNFVAEMNPISRWRFWPSQLRLNDWNSLGVIRLRTKSRMIENRKLRIISQARRADRFGWAEGWVRLVLRWTFHMSRRSPRRSAALLPTFKRRGCACGDNYTKGPSNLENESSIVYND